MTSPISLHRNNNFDLIRLMAALQVLVGHTITHFGLPTDHIATVLDYVRMFPGVPIFFLLSGYLIFASAGRGGSILAYAWRRATRIYPGLWASLIVTIGVLWAFRYLTPANIGAPALWSWVAAVGSIAQFWDHRFFADWANGGVNGALWTLTVELQFYIVAPILVAVLARLNRPRAWLWICTLLAAVVNITVGRLPPDAFVTEFLKVTLAPYAIYFCLGILVFVYQAELRRVLEGRFLIWMATYLVFIGATSVSNGTHDASYFLNGFGLVGVALLTMVVFSAAFSARQLAQLALRRQDISYGVYIYHMVVIGAFVEAGHTSWVSAGLALLAILAVAALSWQFVEKPCLSIRLGLPERRVIAVADGTPL